MQLTWFSVAQNIRHVDAVFIRTAVLYHSKLPFEPHDNDVIETETKQAVDNMKVNYYDFHAFQILFNIVHFVDFRVHVNNNV